MYGVENRFKMQLLLGLKGSPLVGVGILNFATPEKIFNHKQKELEPIYQWGCPYSGKYLMSDMVDTHGIVSGASGGA